MKRPALNMERVREAVREIERRERDRFVRAELPENPVPEDIARRGVLKGRTTPCSGFFCRDFLHGHD